jgi:hypothetical protein
MLLLIVIIVFGLLASIVFHFCSLFHVYNPSRHITLLIQMGLLVIFLSWCIISKKVRKELSSKEFNKSLFKLSPKWLSTVIGFLIIYTMIAFVFSFVGKYGSDESIINKGIADNYYRSFPACWAALYSVMLSLFYSCRRFSKRESTSSAE